MKALARTALAGCSFAFLLAYSPLAKEFWFGGVPDHEWSKYQPIPACTQYLIEYSICTSVVLDIFINRSTDQMNSDFWGVLSPIFRPEYGQSIQMQYICVSFLAKSQLRERGVWKRLLGRSSRTWEYILAKRTNVAICDTGTFLKCRVGFLLGVPRPVDF